MLAPATLGRMRGSALIALLACVLYPYYKALGWANATLSALEAPVIRDAVAQIHALHPQLPRHSRLLFKSDPFQPDRWELTFLIRESYGDASLEVYRVKQQGAAADESQPYDYILDYRDGRYFDAKSLTPPPAAAAGELTGGSAGGWHTGGNHGENRMAGNQQPLPPGLPRSQTARAWQRIRGDHRGGS